MSLEDKYSAVHSKYRYLHALRLCTSVMGFLVSASADRTIRTWNWEDGSLLHAIDPAHQQISSRTNAVRGMIWTNLYMITGGFRDGLVKVWDRESNVLISEHRVVNPAIWHLVGGEGKVAVASKA
jgi:WD40 repeat protein